MKGQSLDETVIHKLDANTTGWTGFGKLHKDLMALKGFF